MEHVHKLLEVANAIIVAICQFLAMVVISIGIAKALLIYLKDVLTPGRSATAIQMSRMELGHSFSLGLGFLIGASILKTTLAPTWTDIGQLAAIITIRTVLNYFLLHDIAVRSESRKPFEGLLHRKQNSPESTNTSETPSNNTHST